MSVEGTNHGAKPDVLGFTDSACSNGTEQLATVMLSHTARFHSLGFIE